MKIVSGIVGIVGAVLAFGFALLTLFFGGMGSAFGASGSGLVMAIGWAEVIATIVCFIAAIMCLSAKNHMPGLILLIAGIVGTILGMITGVFYFPLFMAACAIAGALAIYDNKRQA